MVDRPCRVTRRMQACIDLWTEWGRFTQDTEVWGHSVARPALVEMRCDGGGFAFGDLPPSTGDVTESSRRNPEGCSVTRFT